VTPQGGWNFGKKDRLLQAPCFRLTLTRDPELRVPFPEPSSYDPAEMELFRRLTLTARKAGHAEISRLGMTTTYSSIFFNLAEIPGGKFDLNSGPAAPTNRPFAGLDWLGSDWAGRKAITNIYREYTAKILRFIATDESVPAATRAFFSSFGLCADEYTQNENWPSQLYIREGRRLVGEVVVTQSDVMDGSFDPAGDVGKAYFPFDCKPIRWTVNKDRQAVREGMLFNRSVKRPYGLPYRSMLPKRAEATNLIVSTAVSASHVAFASIRMEPHWMTYGAAAGAAVSLCLQAGTALHGVRPADIRSLAGIDKPVVPQQPFWRRDTR
jgi:hypothetical protein